MMFPEDSHEMVLLRWIGNHEKEELTIHEILAAKTDVDITTEEIRRTIWVLLDNGNVDLTGDMKIKKK
jgi:hypothetical protein